jgi:CRISPR-associated endonuclease/helicase Cas3
MTFNNFKELFREATGNPNPFPYQERFANAEELPELVHAPTGAGKTATAILGWVWRYFHTNKPTPRRLAYCLPMRVLVEQTRDNAILWLHRLNLLDARSGFDATNPDHLKSYRPLLDETTSGKIAVHVLMGGEDAVEWDLHPERPAVLIGTQDMLLSRALNRGYGMGRFRWPMHFGLLNNDCLWVLDEIQLMGTGLATSTQLQAFRESLRTFGIVKTIWMSATLLPSWLASVDYRDQIEPEMRLGTLALDAKADYQADGLRERWEAKKAVTDSGLTADDAKALAAFVKAKHKDGSLTLVIVNTVDRCRDLFTEIRNLYLPPKPKGRRKAIVSSEPTPAPDLKLIHSRFRPKEREAWRRWLTQDAALLRKEHPLGRIVISTQVVEAGVDLSAQTLITELAPWPSLVQRFGRCNRRGEFLADNPAQVFWVDVSSPDDRKAAPYSKDELDAARNRIKSLSDVGLKSLTAFFDGLEKSERKDLFPFDPPHVIRRKDFIDLFDTTPDLAGNDIDVSRFIRDGDDIDVQVFWRVGVPDSGWTKAEIRRQAPQRIELCSVSFIRFREEFLGKDKTAYRWDALEGKWTKAVADSVYSGQIYWIQCTEGGYDAEMGWDPAVKPVDPNLVLQLREAGKAPKPESAYDDDDYSQYELGWQTVAEHTQEVFDATALITKALPMSDEIRAILMVAARWHDWGKSHDIFQAAITKPSGWQTGTFLAKAPDGCWAKYCRKHFRHELASALGVLTLLKMEQVPKSWADLAPDLRNLALYLIASHHGKVRLSIRSMPNEKLPNMTGALFARGVWEGDPLPAVDLGDGVTTPAVEKLDLSPMLLGRANGNSSWAERMLGLREHKEFGPLKLAYLETVLRAADMRASKAADDKAKGVQS